MDEDARKYPRFSVALGAKLCGYTVETTNLSLGGSQVAMPALRYQLAGARLGEGGLELRLTLPIGEPVVIGCELAYASEYDEEYLLGLTFTGVEGEGGERLREFVSSRAGPDFLVPSRE